VNAIRLRALVLVLRYTGLQIGDAVSLSRKRLEGNRLLLYTQKTGVPVYLPLPPAVVAALQTLPGSCRGKDAPPNEEYFFWTGRGLLKSAVADWQRSLRKLFDLAGLWKVPGRQNGHAHRFRDTFAVALLEKGVPIETVSILLGHSSISITEKHYAPWVRSRQLLLEQAEERTWRGDTLAGVSPTSAATVQ
jgi:integrase